nr:MAG TPA: hypothetical protein [Caudoviricetes sp.]
MSNASFFNFAKFTRTIMRERETGSSIGRATDCSVLLLFYFLSKGELVNECLLKN